MFSKGVKRMFIGTLFFSFMGIGVKKLNITGMEAIEIAFFRSLISTIVLLLAIIPNPPKQKGGKFFLLFFRGFAGSFALLLFYYNITEITVAKAFTYVHTSPIFTVILAYIFLKERVKKRVWVFIFIAFFGLVLMTKPGISFQFTDILGILSGFFAASAYVAVRALKCCYDSKVIVLSFSIQGAIFPLFLIPFGVSFIMPNMEQFLWIIEIGLTSTIAQYFMTRAYQVEKAGVVSAISYLTVVLSSIFAIFIFSEIPDIITGLGILVIIFSGIMVATSK